MPLALHCRRLACADPSAVGKHKSWRDCRSLRMSSFDPDKFKNGRKNDASSAKLREEIETKAAQIKKVPTMLSYSSCVVFKCRRLEPDKKRERLVGAGARREGLRR